MRPPPMPDVFAPFEVAQAAGVSEDAVLALLRTCGIRTLSVGSRDYIGASEAVRALGVLARRRRPGDAGRRPLFAGAPSEAKPRSPFAASSVAHFALVGLALAAGGGTSSPEASEPAPPTHMVFLVAAGPGGGGGGGGVRAEVPASVVQRRGERASSSPLRSVERVRAAAPEIVTTPPLEEPLEALFAEMASDERDLEGALEEHAAAPPDTRGAGDADGAGGGTDAGVGEGQGPGIGPGEGGGTGGGPYRPGSGVEAPRLLREVKPQYTEAARSQGIQGDVVIEVVVRRDGSVSDARLLRGLGYGLDANALHAVRQWQFAPARRLGAPVDVIVEVAMEFRLR